MIKIKFKINLSIFFKYFYILTLLLVIIFLSITTKFLYNNFYLSITQSEVILSLSEKVVDETVDINKFDSVIKKIEDKSKTYDFGDINNPF